MTKPERRAARSRRSATERLAVRKARSSDRDAILEISRSIWGGNDYLPGIWDTWVADTEGVLLTVTLDGRPVGCSKISLLSPGEVWLEGLRLHPDLHGRGLSHQIHAATFREARRLNPRTVRYSTWIGNEASRHIAETHGFWLIAQTSWMWGDARRTRRRSRVARPDEVSALYAFVKRSSCYAATGGLMGVGWKFPELTRGRVKRLVSDGLALVYPREGDIRSAALLDVGQIDNDMCLGFVDGSDAEIALLAKDALSVAGDSGRSELSAMLPEGRIAQIVHRSGFDREAPMQAVVYELGARGLGALPALVSDPHSGEPFEDLLDRTYRVNEKEAIDGLADLLIERAPLRLNKQNVRDYVMKELLPDTSRQLMASMHALSNRLGQNEVRLALRAVALHLHREYGLSGRAMRVGPKSVTVRLRGRPILRIACSSRKVTLTLGPGFGPCFAPDIDLAVSKLVLDERTRDRASGRYEKAVLTLTERSHARAAIEAVDTIMKSALAEERKPS